MSIDVTDNINKVEGEIEKGDEKLACLLVVQSPDVLTEDGDPVIEIREELDESGKIICKCLPEEGFHCLPDHFSLNHPVPWQRSSAKYEPG